MHIRSRRSLQRSGILCIFTPINFYEYEGVPVKHISWKFGWPVILGLILLAGCSTRQATRFEESTSGNLAAVHAGPFDTGKMWTFDSPPVDFFAETYGFHPSNEWFEKARLAALRLANCSASFVSEDGLIMTNHHCARKALEKVSRSGERLPETGYYAATLDDERKVDSMYADQLVAMVDVTADVQSAFASGTTDDERIANRAKEIAHLQRRYMEQYKKSAPRDSMVFSVVSFYNGGRYSLYGYKRYTDVRLVYAPEEIAAFFGGDPDNFTYPRYDFDCAFFRIYENGKPLKAKDFFHFSKDGAKEGEVVFVIGNPGRTSRLLTVAQLEFLRDDVYPATVRAYETLGTIYSAYVGRHPDAKLKYMDRIFSLENSRKAFSGYLDGLRDPVIMARKRDFEKKFREAVLDNPELKAKYGDPWRDIAKYQNALAVHYAELNALTFRTRYPSQYLLLAADLAELAREAVPPTFDSTNAKFYPRDFNPEIEKSLLAFRLTVMKAALQGKNEAFNRLLNGRTPEQAADDLAEHSILSSREKTIALLTGKPEDILQSTDPLIIFMLKNRSLVGEVREESAELTRKLQARAQVLGQAMYEVYGSTIPPDATFTLRIADGVVKGYDYNGTVAPPVTTFYGLYDRYYSFGEKYPWNLSDRWAHPQSAFNLSTPMNFVSTNDIIGGNSGSPVVDENLEIVGLIFDGNIESLSGNIIFDDTKNRSVSVHSAGLLEGLEHIYQADRLVNELRAGKIVP
jgi:hypothetical protein